LILEYQGYHNWRNGKYICRLQLDKYDAVKRRPIINLRKGFVNPYNNTFNVSFTPFLISNAQYFIKLN
jgi:hypothetical protein